MSLVSFIKNENPDHEGLKVSIDEALNLIEFNYDENIDRIIIKPNMCYYHRPSTGEVTDPHFIGVLIDFLREKYYDPEISIVESDASAMKCKYAFKMLGYDRLAEDKRVRLINLAKEEYQFFDIEINDWYLRFRIPKILLESDMIINVPKLKYMKIVTITCALKNIFGCNAYSRKSIYHKALNESIVGINKIIRSNLVIVDGVHVYGQRTKRLGLIMASEDCVAVDAAASTLMGINPMSIEHIVLASNEGLGDTEYTAVGDFSHFHDAFPKLKTKDKGRRFLASIFFRFFS